MSLRRFIRRLSADRPSPPPIIRDLGTDEWSAGDLGECIANGPWLCLVAPGVLAPVDGPKKGDLVRVTGVAVMNGVHSLSLEGRPLWWQASGFRKLRPEQHEGSRADWDRLIEPCRRRVDA